jgi:hypothetical protein
MLASEVRQMKRQAETIIKAANNEGWSDDDGTRILANLALLAVQEIEHLEDKVAELDKSLGDCRRKLN